MSQFDRFYQAFPNKRGKAAAKAKWEKMKYDNDIDNILAKLEVEKRWRAQQKALGAFCPEWPMISTYVNQARWEDELESVDFAGAKTALDTATCKCGEPTLGPRFKTCEACYPEVSYVHSKVLEREREIRAYAESRGISTKPGSVEWSALLLKIRTKHGFTI